MTAGESHRAPTELTPHSSMHDRYGGLLRRFFDRAFGPIQYPEAAAERLHGLAQRATIVYVARAPSLWLALYFNHALRTLGLPLPTFVGGINLLIWQPIDRAWRYLWSRPGKLVERWKSRFPERAPTPLEAALGEVALRGEPAFIFLRPQRSHAGGSQPDHNDYFRALVAAQRASARPIVLVPHTIADRSRTTSSKRTLTDLVLGDRRRPSSVRQLAMMLSPSRHTVVRACEPIDISQLVASSTDADEHIARRLRHDVHKLISEEERVVAGPEVALFESIERHVLRNPELRRVLEAQQVATGKSAEALERRASEDLREIAARYSVRVVKFASVALSWLFNRIYDGVVIDETGLNRALDAARKGPLVFCPSHRSHVDYLVLSHVLWNHGVTPPHIAAGANLSFFPLGPLFRGGGAFFLRRSFRDDAVYGAVFRAYVAQLLRNGTSLEFFPEGTRSRTGKLLMPKFGMFAMIANAWREGARDDVRFVPVSIDYDRIIEAGTYEQELAGAEKQPEDVRGLLKSTSVLRSRYGRVHLQFGTPISLADFAREQGLPQDASSEHDAAWKGAVEKLGFRVLHDVGIVCSVTPTAVAATALLSHRGRGLGEGALLERCNELIVHLDECCGRLSDSLRTPDHRTVALLEALRRLADEGIVVVDRPGRTDAEAIYRVREERRLRLDYHKNGLMNHFASVSLVARALLRSKADTVQREDVSRDARFLSRLLKREFLFRADSGFETYFGDVVDNLTRRGFVLAQADGRITLAQRPQLELLATLLDAFVEAYWVTVRTLVELREFPLWDKELTTRALERARRAYLEGSLVRPEAANRTLIENALGWCQETGILEAKQEGKRRTLHLTSAYEGAALERLIDDIRALV